ncbi:MAG TPA: PD-(D/E)XK nuclease family protein [Acidimicrobiales bacterium]|nr:PD-(D/E)XK nuclease family protein [Acidimicrobiales bacterium]
MDDELNPAQHDILDRLGAALDERPAFRPDLRHELRAELEHGVAEVAAGLDTARSLNVAKHALAGVHGCEARWQAESGEFEPSVPIVRGTLVHKALELSVHWPPDRPRYPLDLVDAAMESLRVNDHWSSEFIDTAGPREQAELRSAAGEIVSKFLETWPPLSSRWHPVTETSLSLDLGDGRIRLRGVVDLTLGQAKAGRAGKVVIDLKTGRFSPVHVEDLRFYALVDTLRVGVPPRLLVTYYLDAGHLQPEPVTEDLLWSATARTVDGIVRMAELRGGAEAVRRPSPACHWCPLAEDCGPGQEFLRDQDR